MYGMLYTEASNVLLDPVFEGKTNHVNNDSKSEKLLWNGPSFVQNIRR